MGTHQIFPIMSLVSNSARATLAQLRTIATPVADHRVAPFGVQAIDSRLGAGPEATGAEGKER